MHFATNLPPRKKTGGQQENSKAIGNVFARLGKGYSKQGGKI